MRRSFAIENLPYFATEESSLSAEEVDYLCRGNAKAAGHFIRSCASSVCISASRMQQQQHEQQHAWDNRLKEHAAAAIKSMAAANKLTEKVKGPEAEKEGFLKRQHADAKSIQARGVGPLSYMHLVI